MYCGLLAGVLFIGLSQAATVYLNPSDTLPSWLSPQQARLVLAAHLGLEQFEVVDQTARLNHLFRERDFVGQGGQNALLLLLDETYARDVVPPTLKPSFAFSDASSDPLPQFLATCAQRAAHVYAHVASEPALPSEGVPRALDTFSAPTPANAAFLADMTALVDALEAPLDHFAALELTGLAQLAAAHGTVGGPYQHAAETVRAAVEAAVANPGMHLALVTYAPGAHRRSAVLSESAPGIGIRSSCYGSASACDEATNGCSGHGECTNATRAGQACFVCACQTTVSELGKVQHWAGEMCQRRDVSGPFVLITGTVITLILLMGGAVSLLYGIDSQELPSILTGGIAGGMRRE